MSWVGLEPTIPAFERAKTIHALDRATTVIGFAVYKLKYLGHKHEICTEKMRTLILRCSISIGRHRMEYLCYNALLTLVVSVLAQSSSSKRPKYCVSLNKKRRHWLSFLTDPYNSSFEFSDSVVNSSFYSPCKCLRWWTLVLEAENCKTSRSHDPGVASQAQSRTSAVPETKHQLTVYITTLHTCSSSSSKNEQVLLNKEPLMLWTEEGRQLLLYLPQGA
jgi:hypothetical protein